MRLRNCFDAVIFASTNDELDMDASQKQDLMSFIKEDSKGFVAFTKEDPDFPGSSGDQMSGEGGFKR
jgi:hypothetical protein